MRIFSEANYDFLSLRRRAYGVSAAVVAVGIAAMLFFQITTGSWLNYGVDFTGGTLAQVELQRATSVGELRAALGELGGDASISQYGSDREYIVRLASFQEDGENMSERIGGLLDAAYGAGVGSVVRVEGVGPKVGGELQVRALLAILLSFVVTLIYLAFRFETRFGIAAVVATAHDILVTLGLMALLQMEVSLATVAAVLTIIGYSLNDTIIVFDRIRENLDRGGRRGDYRALVNRSINEVLPRTVMTSGTTLAALLSLALLGGEIIRPFALILILGVVIGTYSSIFVAAPALLEIERRWQRKEGSARGAARESARSSPRPPAAARSRAT
ncbi:MAG TPA: protein translocase subunit SecF [Longimicrobiales bacterium]|nr:protein translocase subunit SecF [Longimicrobiales bacterium]